METVRETPGIRWEFNLSATVLPGVSVGDQRSIRAYIRNVTGGNEHQNSPLLLSVEIDQSNSVIRGLLESHPSLLYRIEFFSNSECDPSGFGEGETFLGATAVITSSTGFAAFSASLPIVDPLEEFITATAINFDTSVLNEETLNTSEFSQCLRIGEEPQPTPTPTPRPFTEFPDADGDGYIDSQDLLKIKKERIDVNGDGDFDDRDILAFQSFWYRLEVGGNR